MPQRDHTDEVVVALHAGPRGLQRLLDAVMLIGSDLDLDGMLQRIIEAAVDLVDARYGALGVLDDTQNRLAQFITVGVDDATRDRIGDLPKGLGLLGSLITDARPLRVAHLAEHIDSSGFPPNHPPMTSFLGVPIRVRNKVFGNLYLTDKTTAEVFTDVDEELATALAAAAGIAIENARLYEQGRRRETALTTMRDLAAALTAELDERDSVRLVTSHALQLLDADGAAFAVAVSDDELVWEAVEGSAVKVAVGDTVTRQHPLLSPALESGTFCTNGDSPPVGADIAEGSAVVTPLYADGRPIGALVVARRDPHSFTDEHARIAETFAAQASGMLEGVRSRQQQRRLAVLEDQERIARDLHQTVIGELFSTGLTLHSTVPFISDARAANRLAAAIEQIDVTIGKIRSVVFDLSPRDAPVDGLRTQIAKAAHDASAWLGFEPRLSFAGPIESALGPEVAADLLAALEAALSRIARHANVRQVTVEVLVADDATLTITHDGSDIEARGGTDGDDLRQTWRSAERHGGTIHLDIGPDKASSVWRVPLTTVHAREPTPASNV